jgi:hypothetical protein
VAMSANAASLLSDISIDLVRSDSTCKLESYSDMSSTERKGKVVDRGDIQV